MNEDLKQLRKESDGDEGFMSGHQIKKIRARVRVIPLWAMNNAETQKVLLRAFPKLLTSPTQRKSASRWGAIIHLFYRMNMSETQVGEELEITGANVKMTLQRIRAHATGKVSNSRGRPKKETYRRAG